MAECVPFLLVQNIEQTVSWYQNIGFKCPATNRIWEPGCELNWARLEWEGAAFMIGIDERSFVNDMKDASLWFNISSIDAVIEVLQQNQIKIELEPATFYGRKVVSFKDINGFGVSFSCELSKSIE